MIGVMLTLVAVATGSLAYLFCFTANDLAIGGYLPFLVLAGSPFLTFIIGTVLSSERRYL